MTEAGRTSAAEAEAAAVVTEVLLRCWAREVGLGNAVDGPPAPGRLRIALPASRLDIDAELQYHSPTGWHRFGPPRLHGTPLDVGLLAALLVREAAGTAISPAAARTALARILASTAWLARFIAARAAGSVARADGAAGDEGAAPFLVAERALITGHPFHPAAKSRGEATDAETARYSPELHGSFPLHWFAAHPDVARHGGPDPAPLLASLRGTGGPPAPKGYVVLPAHPWQARAIRDRPALAGLLGDGRLVDLGTSGPQWYPTASLRTVWRPDAPVMLKLSLGMRITNSRRELHPDELALGAEMARFARLAADGWLRRHHPRFRLVPEPSWVSVRAGGLECSLRTNPFGADDRVVCAGTLVADRPDLAPGVPGRSRRSMLAELLTSLTGGGVGGPGAPDVTAGGGRAAAGAGAVAREWYARYLRVLIVPVLDLYLRRGTGLEAHLQNTLVTLDEQGWPVAGWYRDSQGYYLAASYADTARGEVPGLGEGLPAVFDDALVEQRILYYTVVNNALAIVGALGAAGLADEHDLLTVLRETVVGLRSGLTSGPGTGSGSGSGLTADGGLVARRGLLDRLLDAPTLPCKGNLLTCVDGRDELVGPVSSQSIYVEIPNPLLEVRP
ncbi:IucA/IucC family protein [Parafrankia colletiae]|uniref:IucA/IucC family protein n=1 Tax=Parafrankia colletiae TaxID=573497 RepID=A0A1S1QRX5_9ACTN|nr:IucA/IucC family protein [Parafrankia colletiae]MCK9901384.1 IucA/IucC family protein [Frankia sp. Cpl3]OHV36319.1 IucA/IucC family protein [Parafrankia colletiae]